MIFTNLLVLAWWVYSKLVFKEILANFLRLKSLDPTEFRLWNFTDGRDYYTYIPDFPRPTNFVPYDPEVRHNNEDNDMSRASPPIDQVTSDHMIYMEVGQYSRDSNKRVLPKFDCPRLFSYILLLSYIIFE